MSVNLISLIKPSSFEKCRTIWVISDKLRNHPDHLWTLQSPKHLGILPNYLRTLLDHLRTLLDHSGHSEFLGPYQSIWGLSRPFGDTTGPVGDPTGTYDMGTARDQLETLLE